jgi:hypothetical protein
MQRRAFVRSLFAVSTAGCVLPLAALARADDACDLEDGAGLKSFGYYEGLSPGGTRSASRTDGTYYNMPCIAAEDVAAGVEKTYRFWHGHSAQHTFTVTADDFVALQNGEDVELLTSVVDGHRHALRISVDEACGA